MPLYDYECRNCGHIVEVIHGVNDPGPQACTVCGGQMRKLMSTPAIVFRGSGWAKKDARDAKPAAKSSSKAPGDDAKKPSEVGVSSSDSSSSSESGSKSSNSGSSSESSSGSKSGDGADKSAAKGTPEATAG